MKRTIGTNSQMIASKKKAIVVIKATPINASTIILEFILMYLYAKSVGENYCIDTTKETALLISEAEI